MWVKYRLKINAFLRYAYEWRGKRIPIHTQTEWERNDNGSRLCKVPSNWGNRMLYLQKMKTNGIEMKWLWLRSRIKSSTTSFFTATFKDQRKKIIKFSNVQIFGENFVILLKQNLHTLNELLQKWTARVWSNFGPEIRFDLKWIWYNALYVLPITHNFKPTQARQVFCCCYFQR